MKEALKSQLQASYEFFERSSRSLSEEDSQFVPAEGVFSVAGQVAHVAQTIDWFMDGAFSPSGFNLDFEAHETEVRSVDSLDTARSWLKRAVESAGRLIDEKTEEEWAAPLPEGPVMGGQPRHTVFGGITDHTAHHRGALTTYTRLLGKVPPNPYMET